MARITIEDCLKRIPNRFVIVNLAAKRVRQIREGSEYLVSSPKNEDIVVALREIAAGKVTLGGEKKGKAETSSESIPEETTDTETPSEAAPAEKEATNAVAEAASSEDEAPEASD